MSRDEEFLVVVNRYLDGTATPEEVARLDQQLCQDATARQTYAELLNVDSALADLASDCGEEKNFAPDSLFPPTAHFSSRRSRGFLARWLGLAAVLVIVAWGAWSWHAGRSSYAAVANAVGSAGLTQGTRIRGESFELREGSVELITDRGAHVVIEAPADFRFESAQRLRVAYGRVAAHVPPAAKGFTVVTPTGSAIDLGTDFGVDVPRTGAAEIHVFNGEVIAQPARGARKNLRDGEAVALQSGDGAERSMRSAAFIRPEEMAGLSAALTSGQPARSLAASDRLRQDPAVIALLDFESGELPPGTYRTVQGRWPGSRAPEFAHTGDRLKLDVGGERAWPQFTLAAWVRIDRLGAPYQSLYHTDGWYAGDKPGQVHWMINRDMTMRLALRDNRLPAGSSDRFGYPDSHTSILPEQGRWMHLAVVYDSAARTVRFYLNGRFDKESRQALAMPARFGPAQIGNWDAKDRKLSGRVDELLILGRAMSDDEIQNLYASGNPYQ